MNAVTIVSAKMLWKQQLVNYPIFSHIQKVTILCEKY